MNPYELRQEEKRQRLEAAANRHRAEGWAKFESGAQFFRDLQGEPIHGVTDRNRREKQHAKMDRGFKQVKHGDQLAARAAAVGTGGVSQDDPDAVTKLRAELAEKEATHARMVAVNKIAKSKTKSEEQKMAGLLELGISERTALELLHPRSEYAQRMGFVGFESWELSNSSANIRRIKQRIEHLESMGATEKRPDIVGNGWTIEDDPDSNRIRLTLASRVERDVFQWIRSMGWKWSRTESAFLLFRDHYQRHGEWMISQLNERIGGGSNAA